jgi:hypothetical protein
LGIPRSANTLPLLSVIRMGSVFFWALVAMISSAFLCDCARFGKPLPDIDRIRETDLGVRCGVGFPLLLGVDRMPDHSD